MLVLTRKLNQKIVLPTVNVAVQVVAIRQGQVRLGIDAPPEVTVLREEVQNRAAEWETPPTHRESQPVEQTKSAACDPQLCDRLRTTGMSLGLLRLQLDMGMTEEARKTLAQLQEDFQLLRRGVEGEGPRPAAKPRKHPKALRRTEERDKSLSLV